MFIILIAFMLGFFNKDTIEINQHSTNISYNNCFTLGVICEETIIYYSFDLINDNMNVLCIKNESIDNINSFKDDFIQNSKNCFGIDVDRSGTFNNEFISNSIDIMGGIAIYDKEGNQTYLLGDKFIDHIKNEDDTLFIAYLYGNFIREIFNKKQFSFLYDNSDLSIMDIEENMFDFCSCLQQINCLNLNIRS